MALTSNQQETLHAIVTGTPSGMILKPVDSLVKRGLVVVEHVPNPTPIRPGFGYHPTVLTRYRLTLLGLETYQTLRTKWHKDRLKSLEEEFNRDLAWARGKLTLEVQSG